MGFKIDPKPTFSENVVFRLPGGEMASIRVEYRFFDESERLKVAKKMRGLPDPLCALEIASGWDAEEPFNESGVARLFGVYPMAARAFFRTYNHAIGGAQEKN